MQLYGFAVQIARASRFLLKKEMRLGNLWGHPILLLSREKVRENKTF
jgi:hypothetical protein